MTHLHKDILIHAPLQRVLEIARDPDRWPDWYVGVSEVCDLTPETAGRHEYLSVGMRFPLAHAARQERSSRDAARWSSKMHEPPECARVGTCCNQLMLSGDQCWAYIPHNGYTEVAVDIDYQTPQEVGGRRIEPEVIETLQARTLERTLHNLRALCE